MDSLTFEILGISIAKQGARFARGNGFVRAYDAQETDAGR
jgi:hypothetical protein